MFNNWDLVKITFMLKCEFNALLDLVKYAFLTNINVLRYGYGLKLSCKETNTLF